LRGQRGSIGVSFIPTAIPRDHCAIHVIVRARSSQLRWPARGQEQSA
jgi:hypothetical protein